MTVLNPVPEVVLPTSDEEIWRYSRIEQLDLDAVVPVEHEPSVDGPAELLDHRVVVPVGGDVAFELPPDPTADVFSDLNHRYARPVVIDVPANVVGTAAVVVDHRIPSDGGLRASRLVIRAGDNADVTIVERFVGDDSAGDTARSDDAGDADGGDGRDGGVVDGGVLLPAVYISAGPGAHVRYLAINELPERIWSIGHQVVEVQRDADALVASVVLGGDYSRTRTEACAAGPGSTTRQVALYFAGGDQMHDFRTMQRHVAPRATSDLLFKGAVQDRARSVYTGLIDIGEDAAGTAAHQTNRNLTLSEGAWAESVPNLDIRTNDVKCSHASTVGPIDEEQRFYLESRGVQPDIAERLVVLGFFNEVLAQLPAGPFGAELRAAVSAKLDLGPRRMGEER